VWYTGSLSLWNHNRQPSTVNPAITSAVIAKALRTIYSPYFPLQETAAN
jgi:hypothetical protein